MSGHRWNNRFNPPLQTGATLFPKTAVQTPTIPVNSTTRQYPGAPYVPLYTNQITQVPEIAITNLSADPDQFTVVATVSFGYMMKGTDHLEFTLTNSNTGVSTTKSYMPENQYTIGEFDPGVNYFVYVTPYINGLYTASSATLKFLSSPATAPGLLQGLAITGSGSYAIISFTGLYPSDPQTNQIAVNDNFGNAQILVPITRNTVTGTYPPFVIGPYTNGSSYQFTLTPVTASTGGIYRYGIPSGVPTGNYFIPGPPDTPKATSISSSTVPGGQSSIVLSISMGTTFNPVPESYNVTYCSANLSLLIPTITASSSQVRDLSSVFSGFTLSSALLTSNNIVALQQSVASSNLVADIADNTGSWYSFRVSTMAVGGNSYTFANSGFYKTISGNLRGTSFVVNFNALQNVTPIYTATGLTLSSSVTSTPLGLTITVSSGFPPVFTISGVQTSTYTTFVVQTFANKVLSLSQEYVTIFAGAPTTPINVLNEVGFQTIRWTVGMAGYNSPATAGQRIGPRPVNYRLYNATGALLATTSGFVTTISSGLENGITYNWSIKGFANDQEGDALLGSFTPNISAPLYVTYSNISNVNITINIGQALGGNPFGYIATMSGESNISNYTRIPASAQDPIVVTISGVAFDREQAVVWSQLSSVSQTTVYGTSAPIVVPGVPYYPSNVRGYHIGVQTGTVTSVNLTLTASRGVFGPQGVGPAVDYYDISDNFANRYIVPSMSGDLAYTLTGLSAYLTYSFTIRPFGNGVLGLGVSAGPFNFNPQPPASADLYMTGANGSFLNVSFGGPTFLNSDPSSYYSISALLYPFSTGPPTVTRVDVRSGNPPYQSPAEGRRYQFAVYTTISGITSALPAFTPAVVGGPPAPPTVGYILGCNTITFSLSVDRTNAVVISNFQLTEYFRSLSGEYVPTGTSYTVAVSPSFTPSATYTISGMFTTNYSLSFGPGTGSSVVWYEAAQVTPSFEIIPYGLNIVDPLQLLTYSNQVILTLSQNLSSFSFPVNFLDIINIGGTVPFYAYDYSTPYFSKATRIFDPSNSIYFTWKSGTGPFSGGTYRYDIQSRGNESLISSVTQVPIALFIAPPGRPTTTTNNVTITVNFAPSPPQNLPPSFYLVTDNYGQSISGTTNLSSYVFSNRTTGSAYTFTVTAYAVGISSVPSAVSATVYPGRPSQPTFRNFESSFSGLTATLNTSINLSPYIPLTDICLSIQGVPGYTVTRTNLSASYPTTGPTFNLTNLTEAATYTFNLSAFANQVYSTIPSSYTYYMGSLKPNIPASANINLSDTTAFVTVSAAIPGSIPGSVRPDTYVFTVTPAIGAGTTSNTIEFPGYSFSPFTLPTIITTTNAGPLSFTIFGGGGAFPRTSAPTGYNSSFTLADPGFGGYVRFSNSSVPANTIITYLTGGTKPPADGGPGYETFVSVQLPNDNGTYSFVAPGGGEYVIGSYPPKSLGIISYNGSPAGPSLPLLLNATYSTGSVQDFVVDFAGSVQLFGGTTLSSAGYPASSGYLNMSSTSVKIDTPPQQSINYVAGQTNYTAQFDGLTDQADYTFGGYTITNGLSYGSSWTDTRVFKAGGPRAFTGPVSYSLPAGTPATQTVSLNIVIATGCGGVTGLWSDTSYLVSISTNVVPIRSTYNITNGPGTYSYTTVATGNVEVVVAGGGGASGTAVGLGSGSGGAGGRVSYTFQNVSAGTTITYTVGSGGTVATLPGTFSGSGGGESLVTIGNITVTAGGGGGGKGAGSDNGGNGGGGSYGGAGSITSPVPGLNGSGGPVGTVTIGGGGAAGLVDQNANPTPGGNGYINLIAPLFTVMTTSGYTAQVPSGNTYIASVYPVKNQVTGPRAQASPFAVLPAPPTLPTIVANSAVSISAVYYSRLFTTTGNVANAYTTEVPSSIYFKLAGSGGSGTPVGSGGNGGLVYYTMTNVPAGSSISCLLNTMPRGFSQIVVTTLVATISLNLVAGGGGSATGKAIGAPIAPGEAGLDGGTGFGGAGGTNDSLANLNGKPGTGGNGLTRSSPVYIPPPIPGLVSVIGGGGLGGALGGTVGSPGYIYFSVLPQVTATLNWVPSLTTNAIYYYSVCNAPYDVCASPYVLTGSIPQVPLTLTYGGTVTASVYSTTNTVSSAPATSPAVYLFTSPPTNLRYSRSSTTVTLSWGSAFQPAYPSNIVYTASSTNLLTTSGVYISSAGGGPRVTVGSNLMTAGTFSDITNAANTGRPIVITLSGLGTTYRQSFPITPYAYGVQAPFGYFFSNTTLSALTSYTGNLVFSITNPSALPTQGYTVRDLCSGTVLTSTIYSNTYSFVGTLGTVYNIAVQALNSNVYSLTNDICLGSSPPSTFSNAVTEVFRLSTVPISQLNVTYIGTSITISWATPRQYDNQIPATSPPYSWQLYGNNGTPILPSGTTPSTTSATLSGALGQTYDYSFITNYYGISSDTVYGNQITLSTTPPTGLVQTTLGAGILLSWLTASQSVYLPGSPGTLSVIPPNGGYRVYDLCGSGVTGVSASNDTVLYLQNLYPASPYKYYNFAIVAVHNGISSSQVVSAGGAVFLGVQPVTNAAVTLDGMLATLTWTRAVSNGPNSPYVIYDLSGFQIGDPSTRGVRTITCNSPGIYSFTALVNETIVVGAYGAGGSVGAGGFASNTYAVNAGTTIVAKVGRASAQGSENTTVYVPDFANPKLILDAGGGGGFTISGLGFFRNGGLPYPDGGPPGQPGYGSGGTAALGGGSPAGTDGKVVITMTNQTLSRSILTTQTSISFLVQNNTQYNFQIVSYSNGLEAVTSVELDTTTKPPRTPFQTSYIGTTLVNNWIVPTGNYPDGYLVTNLYTGTYNSVVPGSLSNATFTEAGLAGNSYSFSIYAQKSGIPSSELISLPVRLVSTAPSNFRGDYTGTTIILTASGVPATQLETFTLTDGSENLIRANMPQFIFDAVTTANVQIPPLIGIPGTIYFYKLYGITSQLSSTPVTLSLGLTIPGSTNLGRGPVLQTPPSTSNIICNFAYPNEASLLINVNLGVTITAKGGGGGGGKPGVNGDGIGGAGGYVAVTFPAGTTGTLTYSVGYAGFSQYEERGFGGAVSLLTYNGVTIYGGGGGGAGGSGADNTGRGGVGAVGLGAGGNTGEFGAPGNPGFGGVVGSITGMTVNGTTGGGGAGGPARSSGSPGSITVNVTAPINPFPPGSNKLTVFQCTPPADEFRAVSTTLTSTIYSNLPQAVWSGVAMEIDGGTSIAVNNATNGSNIWVSTNQGLGWGSVFTAGLVGATARNVTIAANGTWGAVTTTSGLWVSSNVSTFSPWFYVGNTASFNFASAGFSPDGSSLVVGQTAGYLYSISSSQLYPGNPSPVFTSGQGLSGAEFWTSIAWSGDGKVVFAVNNSASTMTPVYSITGGTFWIEFGAKSVFTSVSPNSNGTYVLIGGMGYPIAFERDPTNYSWRSVFPGNPAGISNISPLSYRCACSYAGNIQTALILTSTLAASKCYISYDFGNVWVEDTRFTGPFTGSAMSSNGFVQLIVGSNTRIQTSISIPSSSTVVTPIPISLTETTTFGYVPQGGTGYEVIPYRKNISGESVFVWSTPQSGPKIWPQGSGPASFTTPPYASGYSATGLYVGYFVVDNTTNPKPEQAGALAVTSVFTADGTTIAASKMLSNDNVIVYSIARSGGDLYPGVYTYQFAVNSGNKTTVTISVPLHAPTLTSLTNATSNIQGNWTPVGALEPTSYNIYSNGIFYSSVGAVRSASIPNTGISPTTFGVSAVLNAITSPISSLNAFPPAAPSNLTVAGYVSATEIKLTWTSNAGTSYAITSNGTEVTTSLNDLSYTVTLPANNTSVIFGVRPLSNTLLGPFSYVSATNRTGSIFAGGITTNTTIGSPFIVTGMTVIGAGGGGGAGGWGGVGVSLQAGGGGGQGGTLTLTNGTGPVQQPTVVTLAAGRGGTTGTLGNGGGGGTGSYVALGGSVTAWAGGGGGGGGGNGGGGGSGTGTNSTGGGGGTGGAQVTNANGGGGGSGGSGGNNGTINGTFTTTTGQAGESRQIPSPPANPPLATTGGKGGGPDGGFQQPTFGGIGNFARGPGSAGGGASRATAPSSDPNTSPRGGASADGSVTLTYVYLTS